MRVSSVGTAQVPVKQRVLRVGFQGERGAFSQEAARRFCGEDIESVPFTRFEEVFAALKAQKIDRAAIPIENTLHGSVHENYDHLLNFDLPILAETSVRIVHNLIANPGIKFREIRRVYSHPVALAQCLDFFTANPQVERVPFYDTAGSVKMIAEQGLSDAAAIASAVASENYGAHILKRSIEDDRRNFTRFFLLCHREQLSKAAPKQQANQSAKTSIVFAIRNSPGALFRSLSAFALRDLNLTKIESRPLRGKPWEYLFYLDLIGHETDANVQKALGHLRESADLVRVLGSYPKSC